VRPGLEAGEFVLFYQPKASLADGSIAGVEALIRWRHPERGLVPPNDFIPMVERTVLLAPLTRFVLEEALSQWRRWADEGIDVPVAVNLSPRSLLDVGSKEIRAPGRGPRRALTPSSPRLRWRYRPDKTS
jgi:EAL domain-containing protein (putative c-di-GMP-specific phosphodiesterase class I)